MVFSQDITTITFGYIEHKNLTISAIFAPKLLVSSNNCLPKIFCAFEFVLYFVCSLKLLPTPKVTFLINLKKFAKVDSIWSHWKAENMTGIF